MQKVKNSLVGFLVSFVGSIPLGYLNLIGFEIFSKNGLNNLLLYLLGVVLIEGIVIYFTLEFASFLTKQKKWLMGIDVFTIVFLLLLSSTYFLKTNQNQASSIYTLYMPFITGLILSCLNFVQIPFWTGWNLYLVNNNYIVTKKPNNYFFVAGTLFGTFFGMLILIKGLNYAAKFNTVIDPNSIVKVIPVIFFGLALFQMVQFYRKYYRKSN